MKTFPFLTILLMPFFGSLRLSTSKIFLWIEEVDNLISSINARFFYRIRFPCKKAARLDYLYLHRYSSSPFKARILSINLAPRNRERDNCEAECTLYNFLCYENKLQNLRKAKMSWIIKLLLSRINFYKYTSFDLLVRFFQKLYN